MIDAHTIPARGAISDDLFIVSDNNQHAAAVFCRLVGRTEDVALRLTCKRTTRPHHNANEVMHLNTNAASKSWLLSSVGRECESYGGVRIIVPIISKSTTIPKNPCKPTNIEYVIQIPVNRKRKNLPKYFESLGQLKSMAANVQKHVKKS